MLLRLCTRVVRQGSWIATRQLCQLSPREQIEDVFAKALQRSSGAVGHSLPELERFVQGVSETTDYTCSDVSRVLYVCTKLQIESADVLYHALNQLQPNTLRSASVKDLSLCLYCLGIMYKRRWLKDEVKLRNRATEIIVDQLLLERRREDFRAVDASQVVYALATMQFGSDMLLKCLCRAPVLFEMHKFHARDCATLIWSLMKLQLMDQPLLKRLSQRAIEQWSAMKGNEISMVMFSWGCLGKDFIPYVSDAMNAMFTTPIAPTRLRPSHYSNILLTLGRLEMKKHQELVYNLLTQLLKALKAERMSEQSLANALWSLGRIQYKNRSHIEQLLNYTIKPAILEGLSAQGLCNVLMGWAYLEVTDDVLIEILAEEVIASVRLSTYSCMELSLINWSFGRLQLKRQSLLDKLVAKTCQSEQVAEYTERQISTILNGWAKMGVKNEDAILKVVREALTRKHMERYRTFEVADILWSIGALGVTQSKCYSRLYNELMKRPRIARLRAWDVKQALLGFQQGRYEKPAAAYFFREVYDHWFYQGKLQRTYEPDLRQIYETIKELPFIEPVLIRQLEIELNRRKITPDITESFSIS